MIYYYKPTSKHDSGTTVEFALISHFKTIFRHDKLDEK